MKTFCSYFNHGICRSCDLIQLDYRDQIQSKTKALTEAMAPLTLPVFSSPQQSITTHFRNKAKLAVTGTIESPILGLLGENELDTGRELLDCPLHHKKINEMLPFIKSFITEAKLTPYNISGKTGELKGIIIFYSEESHEAYLRFILRSKESITRIIKFQQALLESISYLKVISANIQPIPHAILEGEEEVPITSEHSILHRLGPVDMRLEGRAFVQTNQVVASKLYETATNWVKETNTKNFLELFSGQGAFSFFVAPSVERSLGIEINPDAVKAANQTRDKLNYKHLNFIAADAGTVEKIAKEFNPDVLLVNPPRKGLGNAVEIIQNLKPKIFIYSSCSYETLAQDLKKLDPSYEISKIQIFDMFPNTTHFETLVLLTKR